MKERQLRNIEQQIETTRREDNQVAIRSQLSTLDGDLRRMKEQLEKLFAEYIRKAPEEELPHAKKVRRPVSSVSNERAAKNAKHGAWAAITLAGLLSGGILASSVSAGWVTVPVVTSVFGLIAYALSVILTGDASPKREKKLQKWITPLMVPTFLGLFALMYLPFGYGKGYWELPYLSESVWTVASLLTLYASFLLALSNNLLWNKRLTDSYNRLDQERVQTESFARRLREELQDTAAG